MVSQLPVVLTPGDVEALIECFRLKRVVTSGGSQILGESLDPTRRLELMISKNVRGNNKRDGIIVPTKDWRKEVTATSANVDNFGCGMSAGTARKNT